MTNFQNTARSACLAALAIVSALILPACNESGNRIDQVQTNLVDKSIFQGEWWYSRTNIDVSGDEANASLAGVFQGNMSASDLGVDSGESLHMARIRWVIDEDFLYAYRSYELIQNGNDDGKDKDFRGQPLAVFAIDSHVDVRYDYNSTTGETTNVRVENTTDRRWYDRKFMRVDWSKNLITNFYVGSEGGGTFEPAPFFFQEGAHEGEFPASWRPQFVRVRDERKKTADDPSRYRFVDEWPADADATVHYMSFVTQELYSPGGLCFQYNVPCQTAAITARSAFLRVPPQHEYAVETENNQEYDRFGTFRTYQRTYVRGGADREVLHDHCFADADCGVGGECDTEKHYCVGGLTSDHGETDFLAFYRPRHNFWSKSFDGRECVADWECDNRYGHETTGKGDNKKAVDHSGSVCDKAARQCTIPMAERETRQVAYHLSPAFPPHLVKSAFQVVGEWNEAFMRGLRASKGKLSPDEWNQAPIDCQQSNPTAYCFCGSAEETEGQCAWRYDPFKKPSADAGDEEIAPFDCYVKAAEGYKDPKNPEELDDYEAPGVYGYEFVGEECAFVLHANSCDVNPEAACEELGDIRYQFFNYIQHGAVAFGGVSLPLSDPTTGELITANANVAATSIESVGTRALEFFPVLRCEGDKGCADGEEGAPDAYFAGDNLRTYFAALGRVEHPPGLAPSGADGYTTTDSDRPGLPVDLSKYVLDIMKQHESKFRALEGVEGRARIYSDRMKLLANSPLETKFMNSLGANGTEAMQGMFDTTKLQDDAAITDEAIMDRASPFRSMGQGYFQNEKEALWKKLAKYNIDPPFDVSQRSRYWEYWAEVFRGRPLGEASIRIQQAFLRGIMDHEVGHSVGLRHNFAGSFDRDNYLNGYFNIATQAPLPLLADYDRVSFGGNGDGSVNGEEVNSYAKELRRVRGLRAKAGVGNTMTGSIMDYNGDLSDLNGLGRYDVAAALWNHFNILEAYEGDPRATTKNLTNTLKNLRRADITPRTWWHYYPGGGVCGEDSDCPNSEGKASVSGQPLYQRCVRNPRRDDAGLPCNGDESCVCSNFDDDFPLYVSGAEYRNPSGASPHFPVNYLFCTDDRLTDISWCSAFDAGESFQEAIDHYRRTWEESYPQAYYRRFRTGVSAGLTANSTVDAAKIFQHFLYRLYYEPNFQQNQGPLGLTDQYQASIDAMNWLTEIVQLPQAGSYKLDEAKNIYEWMGESTDMAGADMSLPVGQGFPMWSQYQSGYFGFYRTERAGVFMDKYYALTALALRDWNLSFTIDERFYINFYDLFDVEMTEFFGGLILNNPRWYAPRVSFDGGEPVVHNLNWYRDASLYARCRDDLDNIQPCRGSQEAEELGPAIGGTSNEILRDWAAILALAQFPVFYDTSFETRISVFKVGNGDGFKLPNVQPDGEATCAYGDVTLDPSHVTGCEDPDYVVFDSQRFRTQYVAVKARPRLSYNLDEEQIGFQLLKGLVDKQNRLDELNGLANPTAEELAEKKDIENTLVKENSFLEYLIDVQRQYGISSYLNY